MFIIVNNNYYGFIIFVEIAVAVDLGPPRNVLRAANVTNIVPVSHLGPRCSILIVESSAAPPEKRDTLAAASRFFFRCIYEC